MSKPTRPRPPHTPVLNRHLADHINALTTTGTPPETITRITGIPLAQLLHITTHREDFTAPAAARRILAFTPANWDGVVQRPAIGLTRRIRALYWLAHNEHTIAATASVSTTTVRDLANARTPTVPTHVDARVRAAYRHLCTRRGPDADSRRHARTCGWHGPLAWDDIDNPREQPETADASETDTNPDVPRFVALAEDGLWLERTQGYSRKDAAARLGISHDNLQACIGRARKRGHLAYEKAA